jgi:ketosteroid isomerase-like protein
MTSTSAKETVLAMIDAMCGGDFNKAISFYHDEIDFVGYAPVELFTKLGQRRGKLEVMQTMTAIHDLYVRRRTEIEFVAAEDNRVSVIICLHLQKRENDRVIQLRSANFYELRDGLIAQHRMFLDSFDLLQQVLEIDLTETVEQARKLRPRSP